MWILLNFITVMLYGSAAFIQLRGVSGAWSNARNMTLALGGVAVTCHAMMLYHWIDIGIGQNLTTLNLVSLTAWLVSLFVIGLSLIKPLEKLGIVVFPWAAISMVLVVLLPGRYVIDTAGDPKQFIHILLSISSFSVFVLAGVMAFFIIIMQQRLRQKRLMGFWLKLPALDALETVLFRVILTGLLLLTSQLVTSIYFYHEVLWQHFAQKTLFSIAAWLMFATLILGRVFLGWHGKKSVYCTLGGISFIILAYFSSNIILGYIL
ncbi:MAG: cytochrome c biogenesis protein CcsA [Coxiellaceae bacterium]|nr:cytochrome c biogenesis protein CcsA [Coxiellaceae bacterium]